MQLSESAHDLIKKPGYGEFDLFTRRYRAYCEQSGRNIEDYVVGLKQDAAARFVEIDVLLQRQEIEKLKTGDSRKDQGRSGSVDNDKKK